MTPTYEQARANIRLIWGPASNYECCDCGDPAYDWAYQHSAGDAELQTPADDPCHRRVTPYSANPSDYLPMCRRCHRHFYMGDGCQRPAPPAFPYLTARITLAMLNRLTR